MSGKISVIIEGRVVFNVECTVTADELARWAPERIRSFFNGVAAVLKAKYGAEVDVGELKTMAGVKAS